MVQSPASDVTGLLRAWRRADEAALARIVKLVYSELRDIARRCLSRERPEHTIQATALVHEAYRHKANSLAGSSPLFCRGRQSHASRSCGLRQSARLCQT